MSIDILSSNYRHARFLLQVKSDQAEEGVPVPKKKYIGDLNQFMAGLKVRKHPAVHVQPMNLTASIRLFVTSDQKMLLHVCLSQCFMLSYAS